MTLPPSQDIGSLAADGGQRELALQRTSKQQIPLLSEARAYPGRHKERSSMQRTRCGPQMTLVRRSSNCLWQRPRLLDPAMFPVLIGIIIPPYGSPYEGLLEKGKASQLRLLSLFQTAGLGTSEC